MTGLEFGKTGNFVFVGMFPSPIDIVSASQLGLLFLVEERHSPNIALDLAT